MIVDLNNEKDYNRGTASKEIPKILAVKSISSSDEHLLDLLTTMLTLSGKLTFPSLDINSQLISIVNDPNKLFAEHFYRNQSPEGLQKQHKEKEFPIEEYRKMADHLIVYRLLGMSKDTVEIQPTYYKYAIIYLNKIISIMYNK